MVNLTTRGELRAATPAAWRVLLAYARPYWRALLGGGLLSLATAATGLALPLVVRTLIDDLGAGRSVAGLLILMTGLVIANAGIGAVGTYVLQRAAESVVGVTLAAIVRIVVMDAGGSGRWAATPSWSVPIRSTPNSRPRSSWPRPPDRRRKDAPG